MNLRVAFYFAFSALIFSHQSSGLVWSSYFSGSRIATVDATTGAVLNDNFITGITQPHGILQVGDSVYVANWGNDGISIYDPISGALTGSIIDETPGNLNNPVYLRVGPDGALWVTSQINDRINRYELSTGNTLSPLVISGLDGPSGFVLSPDNTRLFVANRGGGSGYVNEYSLNNAGALSVATLDGNVATFSNDAFGIQWSNADGMLYVGNQGGGLQQVDPNGNDSHTMVASSAYAVGVEIGADGKVYFADLSAGQIRSHTIGDGGSDLFSDLANDAPNFFNLAIVPEPSATWAFGVAALAAILWIRRKQLDPS